MATARRPLTKADATAAQIADPAYQAAIGGAPLPDPKPERKDDSEPGQLYFGRPE